MQRASHDARALMRAYIACAIACECAQSGKQVLAREAGDMKTSDSLKARACEVYRKLVGTIGS